MNDTIYVTRKPHETPIDSARQAAYDRQMKLSGNMRIINEHGTRRAVNAVDDEKQITIVVAEPGT